MAVYRILVFQHWVTVTAVYRTMAVDAIAHLRAVQVPTAMQVDSERVT